MSNFTCGKDEVPLVAEVLEAEDPVYCSVITQWVHCCSDGRSALFQHHREWKIVCLREVDTARNRPSSLKLMHTYLTFSLTFINNSGTLVHSRSLLCTPAPSYRATFFYLVELINP
jgi:hypothetical protein